MPYAIALEFAFFVRGEANAFVRVERGQNDGRAGNGFARNGVDDLPIRGGNILPLKRQGNAGSTKPGNEDNNENPKRRVTGR